MSDKRFEIAPPDRDGRRCVCEWLEITREGERHVFEYFRESTPAPEAPEGWYAPTRCQICGWPLSGSLEKGCVQASCSMRPGEHTEEYRRIQRRMNWIAAQPDMPLCFAYLSRKHQLAPEAASADEQFVAADAGVSVESVREAFAEPAATPSDAVTRDKERKEQIAEVETEIDLLCKVWPAYYPSDSATMERIVDVEKARLAELKRGLREVPRG